MAARTLEIGPVTLPCRIVSTSHQTTLVADHLPTEDFVAYQEVRAAGGAGLYVSAGDCRSPRGLEEAILDGTLAVRSGAVTPSALSPTP